MFEIQECKPTVLCQTGPKSLIIFRYCNNSMLKALQKLIEVLENWNRNIRMLQRPISAVWAFEVESSQVNPAGSKNQQVQSILFQPVSCAAFWFSDIVISVDCISSFWTNTSKWGIGRTIVIWLRPKKIFLAHLCLCAFTRAYRTFQKKSPLSAASSRASSPPTSRYHMPARKQNSINPFKASGKHPCRNSFPGSLAHGISTAFQK